MLKVDKIEFITADNQTYTINKNQLESFPLVGGGEARLVTSQVWNQNGNTLLNSYMEIESSTITFILLNDRKSDAEVEQQRRDLINICNPLKGTIKMQVYLSSGSIYNRDINFVSIPSMPVGLENRNEVWQKVLLQFDAQPFWYAEQELVETFKAVEALFSFPFSMSAADPVKFGTILPSNIAINSGQVAAPVTIKIIGACTNPRIDNITTGEFLKFNNLTMTANQTLEIDTTFGQKKVTLDGVNVFNKLDRTSTFFNLVVGENEIDFSDDTGGTAAAIHFIYKNLYLHV